MYSEIVDGFQEFTVVMPWLSPARLRRIKYVQYDRPIALRHSRQHVRLPDAGHAVIRTKPDSGIRQKSMSGIPSTRPSSASAKSGSHPFTRSGFSKQVVSAPGFKLPFYSPFRFEPLCHPFAWLFIRLLEHDGARGLLTLAAQNPSGADKGDAAGHFAKRLQPSTKLVAQPYSPYDVDFRAQGSYAPYNWELFFHAPLLIASKLMQDARYADARKWLHYIFNPTIGASTDPSKSSDGTGTNRFWQLQVFRENTNTQSAEEFLTALATGSPSNLAAQVKAQINQWIKYPADPHRIAQLRIGLPEGGRFQISRCSYRLGGRTVWPEHHRDDQPSNAALRFRVPHNGYAAAAAPGRVRTRHVQLQSVTHASR